MTLLSNAFRYSFVCKTFNQIDIHLKLNWTNDRIDQDRYRPNELFSFFLDEPVRRKQLQPFAEECFRFGITTGTTRRLWHFTTIIKPRARLWPKRTVRGVIKENLDIFKAILPFKRIRYWFFPNIRSACEPAFGVQFDAKVCAIELMLGLRCGERHLWILCRVLSISTKLTTRTEFHHVHQIRKIEDFFGYSPHLRRFLGLFFG